MDIACIVGPEKTVEIHAHFAGQCVTLSKKLFSDIYVRQYVLANYNGRNSREVAKQLLLTPNWITRLNRKYQSETLTEKGDAMLKYVETEEG